MMKSFTISRWTLFTFYGWLLGVVFILMLSSFLDSIGIEHMQFYLGIGITAGVGLIQWLRFRKQLHLGLGWVSASVIGMGIPCIIFDLFPKDSFSHMIEWSVIVGALFSSFSQYLILKKIYNKALVWILYDSLGWILSVFIVFSIDRLKGFSNNNLAMFCINLGLILGGGIVHGIVTGTGMKSIIKNIRRESV